MSLHELDFSQACSYWPSDKRQILHAPLGHMVEPAGVARDLQEKLHELRWRCD